MKDKSKNISPQCVQCVCIPQRIGPSPELQESSQFSVMVVFVFNSGFNLTLFFEITSVQQLLVPLANVLVQWRVLVEAWESNWQLIEEELQPGSFLAALIKDEQHVGSIGNDAAGSETSIYR